MMLRILILCIAGNLIYNPLTRNRAWALGPGPGGPGEAQQGEKLQQALRTSPSTQVRVQAAAVLAKQGDREAIPALIQTMIEDKSELVRATCAEALGKLHAAAARPALRKALSDPSEGVHKQAELALSRLAQPEAQPQDEAKGQAGADRGAAEKRIPVSLGRMGSKARGSNPDLPKRLREAIAKELRDSPEVVVVEDGQRRAGGGFTVESSVTELSQRTTASGELEVTCEVSMVIEILPSHAIVGMTSGGATIQAPLRRSLEGKYGAQALEADALSHAVRGAHQNLLAFLRHQKL